MSIVRLTQALRNIDLSFNALIINKKTLLFTTLSYMNCRKDTTY
jgi:hypothetical protein